jgi:hypothetical protein
MAPPPLLYCCLYYTFVHSQKYYTIQLKNANLFQAPGGCGGAGRHEGAQDTCRSVQHMRLRRPKCPSLVAIGHAQPPDPHLGTAAHRCSHSRFSTPASALASLQIAIELPPFIKVTVHTASTAAQEACRAGINHLMPLTSPVSCRSGRGPRLSTSSVPFSAANRQANSRASCKPGRGAHVPLSSRCIVARRQW